MLIPDLFRLELFLILGIIDALEDILKATVILLEDCVFAGEVKRVFSLEGKLQAAFSKLLNAFIGIVHGHAYSALSLESVHFGSLFFSTFSFENNLESSRFVDCKVSGFILVSKGMPTDNDGLFPSRDESRDVLDDNGFAEDSSIENIANSSIRAFPHLFQSKFFHPCLIRGDGGTLDTHFVFLDGFGSFNSHLVLSGITILHTEVVVGDGDIKEGVDKLILDGLPYNPGHFITIHLHYWIHYLYLAWHMMSIISIAMLAIPK